MQAISESEPSLLAVERAFAAAVAISAPSVVRVARRRGAGSGLAWTDELIVTSSFHTPDDPVIGVAHGDAVVERAGRVLGRDRGTDVALVAVDGGGLTPIGRRDLAGVAAGQLTFAVARPGQAIRASLRALGVVGPAVATPGGGRLEAYLETDRGLPRGFAGGPLVDLHGRALGMNTRTVIGGADLCVPIATLARVVDGLRAHGRIARGYLGVAVQAAAIPAAVSDGRGVGALVVSLEDDGPAARGGLFVGDVIVAIGGVGVDGPAALRLGLLDRADAAVELAIVRGGAPITVTVTVGSQP